jgi:hypothetical protein
MPDLPAEFLELIHISDLASPGPEPRPSRLSRSTLDPHLDSWFKTRTIAGEIQPALSSAALLWHDYLEESHVLSQDIPTTTGSFLHAIMHRREPDYNNARYWFHRVGRHDSFYAIARAATPFLVKQGETQLCSKLLPNGLWNPFAFVDACAEASRHDSSAQATTILRQIQRIEFESIVASLFIPHPNARTDAAS